MVSYENPPDLKIPGTDQEFCIYLFYDRVEAAFARSIRITSLELILGITMAHEIGHLLLPPGHSLRGIMRARLDTEDWKLAEIGWLGFGRREADRITKTVNACNRQPETIRTSGLFRQ